MYARHHVDNRSQPWSLQALATALAALPLQERLYLVGPSGGHAVPWPSDETLTKLQNATSNGINIERIR
jgi:hypothetical protein